MTEDEFDRRASRPMQKLAKAAQRLVGATADATLSMAEFAVAISPDSLPGAAEYHTSQLLLRARQESSDDPCNDQ